MEGQSQDWGRAACFAYVNLIEAGLRLAEQGGLDARIVHVFLKGVHDANEALIPDGEPKEFLAATLSDALERYSPHSPRPDPGGGGTQ